MNLIRDSIIELFLDQKGKKIVKFFVSPCFSCKNLTYEMYSYPVCEQEYDFPALEYFTEHKKSFPYCEDPKMCHRKWLFRPRLSMVGYQFDEFDGIGYGLWASMEDIDYDAPSIAGGVIGFHRRMSCWVTLRQGGFGSTGNG